VAPKRKIKLEDLWKFQFVSDAQISPDGESILFTRSRFHPDKKKNRYDSHIWRVGTKSGASKQWTSSAASESTPRWSPTGDRILFLSARGSVDMEDSPKVPQIWVMPSTGGEGVCVTDLPGGASSPLWSPCGRWIALVGRVPVDPDTDDLTGSRKPDVMHIRRTTYRHDLKGYQFAYRQHLFIVPSAGGRPRQITKGDWDAGDFAWTPDGKQLLVCGNLADADHTYARELYSVSIATGRVRTLCALKGPISAPAASPDGRTVTFVGNAFRRGYASNSNIFLVPSSGGTPQNVTHRWDLSVGQTTNTDSRGASPAFGPTWSPDGSEIKFLSTLRGATHLFSTSPETGDVIQYTSGDWTIESLTYSDDHTSAVYTGMSPTELAEVWVWEEGRSPRQRTRISSPLLNRLSLTTPERFNFRASDGVEVEGWVMLPPESRRKRHPALLEIHGGPRSAYGMGFMHEFHLLNASGYAVVYLNPRGSSSYGEEWACAGPKHYGERDYEDLMEGINRVLRKYPIDPKRLGVLGGSYGGFMTNWIVGHTNRFKAACTQRCISNWISFFGTSDIGNLFGHQEIGGPVWKSGGDLKELWKRSPLAYVEQMKTPLLIIHSEEDWRCPIEQSEQLFTALKWLDRDTEFVRVPGESHELSRSGRPLQRIARLEAILDWFKRKL